MSNNLYPMFVKLKDYLYQDPDISEIKEALPEYYGAILAEVRLAEDRYVKHDAEGTKEHIKKTMGYCKRARILMKGEKS